MSAAKELTIVGQSAILAHRKDGLRIRSIAKKSWKVSGSCSSCYQAWLHQEYQQKRRTCVQIVGVGATPDSPQEATGTLLRSTGA